MPDSDIHDSSLFRGVNVEEELRCRELSSIGIALRCVHAVIPVFSCSPNIGFFDAADLSSIVDDVLLGREVQR